MARQSLRLLPLLTAALLGLCALGFVRTTLIVGRRAPLNYNEGWNAYHSADVAAGRPLYPDPSGTFFNNYPPLSFLAVAPLVHVVHDPLVAGRALATASLLVWVVCLGIAVRRLGGSRLHAAFAAALLAVYMFVFSSFYVGVDDPQIFGHALQALGLLVLLGRRRSTVSLALAAVLLAAGVFVKNNLVALPIASVVWLWTTDRPSAWRLAAFGAAAGLVGATASVAAFGPQSAAQILAPRFWAPAKGMQLAWLWTRRMALPLAVAVWLSPRVTRDARVRFALIYLAVAIAAGWTFAMGDGVYWNTMFDADAAIAVTAGVALECVGDSWARGAAVAGACLAAAALAVALSATIHWLSPRFWFDPLWFDVQSAGREVEFLRTRPGPALCENLIYCYWAGKKDVGADFFNLGQYIRREPRRADALVRRLEARDFSAAQIEGRDLGPRVRQALQQNYRVDHESEWGTFWVPR